jgi:SAM-dependent methyltransferase
MKAALKIERDTRDASLAEATIRFVEPYRFLVDLWRAVPLSLALREANRYAVLREHLSGYLLRSNTLLDVGCGDGTWWHAMSDYPFRVVGVDLSARELRIAASRIHRVVLADVASPNFKQTLERSNVPTEYECVIANCSLEHVENITAALENIFAMMKPNSTLILFVPTPTWALQGRFMNFLMPRSRRIAMTLSGAVNGFFQHWHLYHRNVWCAILRDAGFEPADVIPMGNRKTEFLFRLMLLPAFFAFLFKTVVGHYPNRYIPRFAWRLAEKCLSAVGLLRPGMLDDLGTESSAYEYAIRCTKR